MGMMEQSLESIQLFADLPPAALDEVEERCRWHHVQADDLVFDRESDCVEVYFVVSGSVRILNAISPDRDVALADIPAGGYFGELSAIDGMRRSARVVALQESLLAALDGRYFIEVLRGHPAVAVRLLEKLSRIIRDLDGRVSQITGQNEQQRIWSQLLRLAEPSDLAGSWIIRELPNHKEIADWSGTRREQVAQAIGDLAREGVVRRRSRDLVILDLPRLRLMAMDSKA